MAKVFKTPGVYIEEISKSPLSVAQVKTAVPAFVGYTEKAEKWGEPLLMRPTRISTLLEYREFFGGDNPVDKVEIMVDETNNFAVEKIALANNRRYLLYDSLRLFFDNGGGPCYIVSVGKYGTAPTYGDENLFPPTGLRGGVKALEKYDEPTIILFPDAINVIVDGTDDPGFYGLQQMALEQCARLKDRVGVLDLKENINADLDTAVFNFRNNIGINNLKYGGAYSPYLITTYHREVDLSTFEENIRNKADAPVTLKDISQGNEQLALINSYQLATEEAKKVKAFLNTVKKADLKDGSLKNGTKISLRQKFLEFKKEVDTASNSAGAKNALKSLFTFFRNTLSGFQTLASTLDQENSQILKDINSYAKSARMCRGAAKNFIAVDKNKEVRELTGLTADKVGEQYSSLPKMYWLNVEFNAIPAVADETFRGSKDTDTAKNIANAILPEFEKLVAYADAISKAAEDYKKASQDALYEKHPVLNKIIMNIKRKLNTIPPSGAVAGIYAKVDNDRGVWKAPANVSINSVSRPTVLLNLEEQANLNVDLVSGKSINAIRAFTGKGVLVWGARTLAGNDNEWRYVNVRRFFNMVEESCKKSTESFVFEPNNSSTWLKVQTMLENFLITLWKQGALQGAKPEHAFYVAVGLGKTMSAQDILEGKMIVEIGMAVLRPAEFIVLQFSKILRNSD